MSRGRVIDVVIPTIGRGSLATLLSSIARASGPRPGRIFVVDDRRDTSLPLNLGDLDEAMLSIVDVVSGAAAGPASARNRGWRSSRATWIAFIDDDVVVDSDWLAALSRDLADLPFDVAGSTGIVRVPLPSERKPTDWERNVAALETARWITADCAYRRADLAAVGGFDERFERAYREDADLALRVIARGKRIVYGERRVTHPVGPASDDVSIRLQAGNADDVLMRALHGSSWRERADAPLGALPTHVATVALASIAVVSTGAWLGLTSAFAWRRIALGPRDVREVCRMIGTSFAIPFAAVWHRVRGMRSLRARLADGPRGPHPVAGAVLFDRDGTLIVDVPYNGDPDRVRVMPHAIGALEDLRAAGIPTAVVSNQSAVALGKIAEADVHAVNVRTAELLGPLGPFVVCMHGELDGCACRKPQPGLIHEAARMLGVRVRDCVVIGDIGSDLDAATAAGARAILVPTEHTRANEVASARFVAGDIAEAVRAVLAGVV